MKPEQQNMVNHLIDLDRKIGSTQFNLDQLNVGKQAFLTMLRDSLNKVDEVVQ
jgi:restriction endonuclease S subunit